MKLRSILVLMIALTMAPIASAAEKPTADQMASFKAWLASVAVDAEKAGLPATLIAENLDGLKPNMAVVKRDASQPEYSQPPWGYLDRRVAPNVKTGIKKKKANAKLLAKLEKTTGVPANILMAIWGLESNFGGATGRDSVLQTLATLGWMGSEQKREAREAFGRAELIAALRIIHENRIPKAKLRGSWAGAMGYTQVIPTSFLRHGTDFDGDGKVNLWSAGDSLATAAALLKAGGWKAGLPWGIEVRLPKDFDYIHARLDESKTIAEWEKLGLKTAAGKPLGIDASTASWLVLPAGHQGPAFLVTANFHAILDYNFSINYALAVGRLSDRIGGKAKLKQSWPRKTARLKIAGVKLLQELLTGRGHDTGGADGKIGMKTRAAIRAEQKRLGLPADAWPTPELLDMLRDADE